MGGGRLQDVGGLCPVAGGRVVFSGFVSCLVGLGSGVAGRSFSVRAGGAMCVSEGGFGFPGFRFRAGGLSGAGFSGLGNWISF